MIGLMTQERNRGYWRVFMADSTEEGTIRLGRSVWKSIFLADTSEDATIKFKGNGWQVEGGGVRTNQWSKIRARENTRCDGNNQWMRACKDEYALDNNIIGNKAKSTRKDWGMYKLTITNKEVK